MSGEPINPYNEDASEVYPEGTVVLSPSVTALGHITFKDNNDGTVTFYDVPSHFQDHRWTEDGYSKQETARILKNGQTKKIKNALDSDIEKVVTLHLIRLDNLNIMIVQIQMTVAQKTLIVVQVTKR